MADADREIARRLLHHRQHFEREEGKAQKLEAEAQGIRARIGAEKGRADQGLPDADACPDCWVQHGKKVTMVPKVSVKHDKFDRWGCPSCGWHFDVLAR
ncbi:MAG TPA: hypothetical protein VN718_03045 [Rhizomicrobium sp.]|nr:hypothetical protein [Rhizomicrobium sp.]